MIGAVFEVIIPFVFHVIVEIFFIGTGELIFFILTFGKRKPIWNKNRSKGSFKLGIFLNLSFIIGFIFWFSIACLIFKNA